MSNEEIMDDIPSESVDVVQRKINDKEYQLKLWESGRSEVWKNFFRIENKEQQMQPFASCKFCHKILTYSARVGTTGLLRHKCFKLGEKAQQLKPLTADIKKTAIKKCVDLCAKDLRSFNIVTGKGFQEFTEFCLNVGATTRRKNIQASDLLPCTTTIMRNALGTVEKKRKILMTELKPIIEKGYCSATTDIWTDEYRQRSYLTLTVHYIDGSWNMKRHVLFTTAFPHEEKKTGDNIMKAILKEFGTYNITDYDVEKINFVTDNGSNMIKALEKHIRYPCIAHILHNIIKETFAEEYLQTHMAELNKLLRACKKLVRYMKKSGDVQSLNTTLKQHIDTRWNTLYSMMFSIKEEFDNISTLYANTKQISFVNDIDLPLLSAVTNFLHPFKKAIEDLEREKQPTIHRIILCFSVLRKHLNSFADKNDSPKVPENTTDDETTEQVASEYADGNTTDQILPEDDGNTNYTIDQIISVLATKALLVLSKRFTKFSLYMKATFLWPKFKQMRMLEVNEQESTRSQIKESLAELSFEKELQDSPTPMNTDPVTNSESSGATAIVTESSSNNISTFSFSEWEDQPPTETPDYVKEFENYQLVRSSEDNPLEFWRTSEAQYPFLSTLARKILNIPATSAPSERVFSNAGRILEERRTCLSDKSLDALLFLHSAQ